MDEIDGLVEKMKTLQNYLIEFIEKEDQVEENYENFENYFKEQKISKDQCDFKSFLYILLNISNNHYRTTNFFIKIEKIFLLFKDDVKANFSNFEIFYFFKSNKRILLFLIQEKILIIDELIASNIIEETKFNIRNYIQYFFFDIKKFFDNFLIQNFSIDSIESYNEKRKIGENDDEICYLIRKDLIDEFISYVKKNNYPLNSKINQSIFETNNFILKKEPTLIEYASFFGSTQIFKYLYLNGVELTPSIWIYAMHCDNPEMIHLLIENNLIPEGNSYYLCLKESIKCYNNDIANYLINNFLNDEINNKNLMPSNDYNDNLIAYSFRYHNYAFFPKDFNHKFIFFFHANMII